MNPQSCIVTETLNGEWELTLVHPIDEFGKWQRLAEGNILRAPVPAGMTPQVRLVSQSAGYDIYKITTKRDPLRLRSGTGTKYKILGKYKKGTEVLVLFLNQILGIAIVNAENVFAYSDSIIGYHVVMEF